MKMGNLHKCGLNDHFTKSVFNRKTQENCKLTSFNLLQYQIMNELKWLDTLFCYQWMAYLAKIENSKTKILSLTRYRV